MLWHVYNCQVAGRECYHCKRSVEEGEAHDCWTTTEAALTRELSEDLQEAWERLRETAADLGDQRIYASHHSIMFSRKSCYFFVRPKRSYLEVCIFLGRAVKAPQIQRAAKDLQIQDRALRSRPAQRRGGAAPHRLARGGVLSAGRAQGPQARDPEACSSMTTCIALLRGINIVGRNRVSMKDLTVLLEKEGFAEVRTYIQSGNVLFRGASSDTAAHARRIGALILKRYGFEPKVLVITDRELVRAAAANPFPEADSQPQLVHLFFLAERPKKPDLAGLEAIKTKTERFRLAGQVFYLHTPDGFGTSKLAVRAERLLGVDATARNWRTVTTLREMAARPK